MDGAPQHDDAISVLLVVDDYPENLVSMRALLQRDDWRVITAASGLEALELLLAHDVDLVLLDVRMPGMNGLALFDLLAPRGDLATMPVIFLTGHADVPTAVDTVKRGAFDFCEKPFSDNAMVDRIEQALALSAEHLSALRERSDLQVRLGDLTERERDVMDLVVAGLPNKLIADQLDISVRTVEVHRSRVFDKMQVKSAVELANLLRTGH